MIHPFILTLIVIVTIFATNANAKAENNALSLLDAETLALENDPMLESFAERRRAMRDMAIADAQLPDPSFKIGAANLPVDSFKLSQEPMTQLQFGLSQRFPRGDSLRARGEQANARADIEGQKQNLRLRETLFEVRTAWLDAYYWQSVVVLLNEQLSALEELVGVTQAHYATGRGQQQDVLRSQLEVNLLRDKIINAQLQHEKALSSLAMWTGVSAKVFSVEPELSGLRAPSTHQEIKAMLLQHPVIGIGDAEVKVEKAGVVLARQAYKPEWGVDLSYGARVSDALGNDRSDFLSVMVKVDIPFFTGNRQDKRLSAARHQEAASKLKRDEKIRQLGLMLDNAWLSWNSTSQRLELYSKEVIEKSHETYTVTLNAYQNQVADFSLLIRARLLDFDTKLKALDLLTQHQKANASLLYIQGEE